MAYFSLQTTWQIPAPDDVVWKIVSDTEQWPLWWKYVRKVEELSPGDPSGVNNLRRYYWSTCLPYQLILDLCITRIEPCKLIETSVSGDLEGEGRCLFSRRNNLTILRYDWNVELCKPWMKWFAPIARPVFEWNHQQVMKQGEQSLIQHIEDLAK